MKRISKSMFRGAIAQPTSFKLCRMVQTYMLGMEPQKIVEFFILTMAPSPIRDKFMRR